MTPYVTWLNSAAAEAEQTASQARAAASAYQAAFAAMVPPEVIAANRSSWRCSTLPTLFGQNTPAIAMTEAQYGEMWAQDAGAMYGYAGNSAAASRVTAFTAPPSTTNPAGSANQASAVGPGRRDVVRRGRAVGAVATGLQRSRARCRTSHRPPRRRHRPRCRRCSSDFLNSLTSVEYQPRASSGIPGWIRRRSLET